MIRSFRRFPGLLIAGVLVLGSAGITTPGAAQIQGSLLDTADDQPIVGASVSLVDAGEEVVQQVVTDSSGRFRVTFPISGRYVLKAERIGYVETVSPPLDLRAGDSLVVMLHMSAQAVALAPLTVEVAPSNNLRSRILDGFYHRQRRGWGTYFGPEEIERFRPNRVTNLLQNTTGMRLRYRGTRTIVRMRGTGARECVPTILVDGHRLPGAEIDHWVPVSSLRAVEVYSRAMEVPGEFAGRISHPNCGAILIWTTMSLGR